MAKRKIIKIDEEKCTGCGDCIPNCPEGAIQIIDGKARLISDLFCDGLGACIGSCPVDAIVIEEREAEKYDERKVMENIIKQGANTVKAHLGHLRKHGETKFLNTALEVLKEKNIVIEEDFDPKNKTAHQGCPGAKTLDFADDAQGKEVAGEVSALRQWPIQLHLISPQAPYFQGRDVLLAADCVPFALANFHRNYLAGNSLAIGCPKLDSNQEIYLDKLKSLIDESKINTLTVMIMEVPCCGGLLYLAQEALKAAKRKIPIKKIIVSLEGEIANQGWANT